MLSRAKGDSGIVLESFLGGIVEIVLFMVLLSRNNSETDNLIPVIQAAILGSILANLLLCLGFCFFVGGMNREEQTFAEAISEVGSGLMLVAGFGLLIPSAFFNSLKTSFPIATLDERVLKISRVTAVILLVAFLMCVYLSSLLSW
jgi:Ca2+:H+ antiporter